ncbi:DUF3251 domain-containing protein [Stigmatella hybrida]|uniref:DUF3251 domain-containing protein n=1 Tax=Stigmatella hybrida TaxID=394097 RepID=UPI001CDA85E6|nr:DUF3251 domain-containing protein [Stigmatella hybrida]
MRLLPLLAFLPLLLTSNGCTKQPKSNPTQAKAEQAIKAIEKLDAELMKLQAEVSTLNSSVSELHAKVIKLSIGHQSSVTLEPGSRGYSPLLSNGATFLVSLQKIAPYADGQRLTLHIGNPQSISYKQPTIYLKWGKRFEQGESPFDVESLVSHAKWEKTLRSKEEKIITEIAPGAWNTVTITAAPATSEEIGYIELAMDVSTVSMNVR